MMTIVFLVEEPSAQDALEGLLPRILSKDVDIRFLVFEGKQDLEKRMGRRMRGWLKPETAFVVLRDQDSGDCRLIKERLASLCREAGREDAVVRIACRTLEAWFVGDWDSVGTAFEQPRLANLKRKAMYQDPDRLSNPVTELRKVIPDYQKRDGARRIGRLLDPARNSSRSFRLFVETVRRLAGPQ
ncbi:DUF4276 family protein [Geobacter benzoatilyticus]|uniref:DUF4276 family protein n=2 Tax=Geobacter benzoatilyticus TaxID=2815309 RepID=A0ABX7Q0M2_9BACT|nr:DUF4276 family protein [Geobacter benzoatilyticus]